MKLFICCTYVLLLVSFTTATETKDNESVKNKRELPPGPSYKYLPPSVGRIGGGGGGGVYSSGRSPYDFDHGSAGYHGAGSDIGHVGHDSNVETYIIQTSGSAGKGPTFGSGSFSELSVGNGGGAGGYRYPNAGLGVTLGHKVVVPSASYGSPSLSFNGIGAGSYSGGHGHGLSVSGLGYSGGHSPSVTYGTPGLSFGAPSTGYSGGVGSHYQGSSGLSTHHHGGNSLSFIGSSSSLGGSGVSFGGPSSHGSSPISSGNYYTSKHTSSIPSSVYGAPSLSSYSTKYSGGPIGVGSSPNYAIGQKGLGHYSYSSSKPAALNTDFVSSSSFSGGHGKAPFKPSAFLGSSQDSVASSHPSNQYLPPTPSQEYLPASHSFAGAPSSSIGSFSGGTDSSYHVPSTVYGAPSDSGNSIYDQTGPNIHDNSGYSDSDESQYVTPGQSYGAPSPPGKNYLPPSSSYGTPSSSYGTPSHH